jgi:hypothetical protein
MRIALIALIGVVAVSSVNSQPPTRQQPTALRVQPGLDSAIGAANPAQYRAVSGSRDWRNPWLDARDDGFRLKSRSSPKPRFVALSDLRRVLRELPVSDWPYGRVVVVQYPSIVPGDEKWIAAMRKNFSAAIELLAALDADWWGWPP